MDRIRKILVANRGEIACRVMKTAHRIGIACVAVYSDADRRAKHVELAGEAFRLGPAPVAESYLKGDLIIEAAVRCGAQAIHPGYGFLSENPDFVQACESAGLVFIGPPASAIRAMGLKDAAKALMEQAGVPVVPGYHGKDQDSSALQARAAEIGYPVLIKARAGGGGKGMRGVDRAEEFPAALEGAQREGKSSFGDSHVLIEKYISTPRHIEVQVFADTHGNAVYLFERDCSLQRRHQKVIEEAPAPGMTASMREAMGEAAVRAATAVGYVGAGTVEFIADASDGLREDGFYFMEMNTRLQVEHPVTEAITGTDLVEWQLRVAAGEPLPADQDTLAINGHAFEARIYAEDARNNFMPATGTLAHLSLPEHRARIDSGVRQGDEITPFYDPMIAKLIVHGQDRETALGRLTTALAESRIVGCVTNVEFLTRLSEHQGFATGEVDTGLIGREMESLTRPAPAGDEVVLFAALAALGYLQPRTGCDPWDTLTGWRHWSAARQYTHLTHPDGQIDVSLATRADRSLVMYLADRQLRARLMDHSGSTVTLDFEGRIERAAVVAEIGAVHVFYRHATHVFGLPDLLAELDIAAVLDRNVVAPMPGVVTSVKVSAGDSVLQGDTLVVMEAMKMEHTLKAVTAGIVAELNVAAGDQVSEGTVLLSLDPVENSDG